MKKIILTYNDIYKINQILENTELCFKIHLHDMCGSQSYTVEPLDHSSSEEKFDDMKKSVTEYFEKRSIAIRFLENNLEFVIVQ